MSFLTVVVLVVVIVVVVNICSCCCCGSHQCLSVVSYGIVVAVNVFFSLFLLPKSSMSSLTVVLIVVCVVRMRHQSFSSPKIAKLDPLMTG